MKFVVKSDFLNVPKLRIKPVDKAPHKNHIPAGARIEIGTTEDAKDLTPSEQEAIGILLYAGRIVPASNDKAVKEIDSLVALAAKSTAAASKQESAPAK